jgi:uncharacterized membrane protein YccC
MSTIDEYRNAKATYLKLQAQAKKDLLSRFSQLEAEMAQVQRELREDFGVKVSPNLGRKGRRAKNSQPADTPVTAPDAKKVRALERKLTTQRRNLDQAQKDGKPDKPIKDRIYEIEDEIRLASG